MKFVCLADSSHEISSLIFLWKKKTKKKNNFRMLSASTCFVLLEEPIAIVVLYTPNRLKYKAKANKVNFWLAIDA